MNTSCVTSSAAPGVPVGLTLAMSAYEPVDGGEEKMARIRHRMEDEFLAATEGRSFARHWTPIHLDFAVEDLARSTAEITRLGGSVEDRESGDWGSLTRCVDPFGNGFCLLTN